MPGRFTPREGAPGSHWIGDLLGPRAGRDVEEKRKFLIIPGLEPQPFGRPVGSQSLYQLRYPGNIYEKVLKKSVSKFLCAVCMDGWTGILVYGRASYWSCSVFMGLPITDWCPVHMNVPDPKTRALHMGLKT
jgi:hypothetical protein